jgi:hypothetical protein
VIEADVYAQKANRLIVLNDADEVVAVLEVVSPVSGRRGRRSAADAPVFTGQPLRAGTAANDLPIGLCCSAEPVARGSIVALALNAEQPTWRDLMAIWRGIAHHFPPSSGGV